MHGIVAWPAASASAILRCVSLRSSHVGKKKTGTDRVQDLANRATPTIPKYY